VVDNFITGSRRNRSTIDDRDGFEFFEHDTMGRIDVDSPVEALIHLASPAFPTDYLRFPIETLRAGSLGTFPSLDLPAPSAPGACWGSRARSSGIRSSIRDQRATGATSIQ